MVFDSTGLKVYGEGEWKVRTHGASKRRTWRKLHIGANPDASTGSAQVTAIMRCAERSRSVAVELTTVEVGDGEVLPELAQQLGEHKIGRGYGDGAYDTRACYDAIAKHGGEFITPPRENAAYWEAGHPRNEAVAACRKEGRKAWKEAMH